MSDLYPKRKLTKAELYWLPRIYKGYSDIAIVKNKYYLRVLSLVGGCTVTPIDSKTFHMLYKRGYLRRSHGHFKNREHNLAIFELSIERHTLRYFVNKGYIPTCYEEETVPL